MDRVRIFVPLRNAQVFGLPDSEAQNSGGSDRRGFIGLETAENLVHRGFDVTLVEMLDQVLAPLDQEMARIVEGYVERHGIHLALNDGVAGFKQAANGAVDVLTKSGKTYPADIVILSLGVRPDITLAKGAGLEIGKRGGIRVDDQMRASNADVFAVGAAIEVKDSVTGEWSLIALAGPANRQGRIAADVIAGRESRYRGTQGTSIIGLFSAADRITPYTANARTKAIVIDVVPQVSGYVSAVAVTNSQIVEAGILLARIDTRPFALQVEKARSDLQTATQEVGASSAQVAAAQANLAQSRALLENAEAQAQRTFQLERQGVTSPAAADQMRAQLLSARGRVAGAEADLARAKHQLGEGTSNARIHAAITALQTFPTPHTAHLRTWLLVVLVTQTPPTRVLPGPHP